ncbi:DUF6359 domain-containing protein [Paenibacillus sp. KQZ6P-2]|uniref:DUF6359 domain-containing protein n=2 Tax=Paenibacillus mangrovi TaxID=2931978 RepID=A0A9X1WXS8_9BACL|nr:DUF6359 domain-containing protein [Paenibacillus mangrovi]MCJ8014029.1 DUF6359 domain-containing protein [Paenibacillus mangrovi]
MFLIFSSVLGYIPAQAASSVLTVAQALAKNNSGESATVEGYIVGEVYNSKLIFSGFQDDLNVLIADSPSETNKDKLIDVQVSNNYRSQVGLKANPANLGKKLQVTGTLTAYSGMPGIKSPTGMTVAGESGGGDPGNGGGGNPADPGSENIGVPTTLPDGTGKKVLFDETHGQTAGAADWVIDGAFSDFADGLRKANFQVDALQRTLPMNAQSYDNPAITLSKLKQYDVFIIGEANIPFKASEQDAMLQYVKEGGSIFFISDHYNSDRNLNRWDSSEVMNGYRRGAFGDSTKGMPTAEAASSAMKDVTSTDWLGQNFGVRFRYNSVGDVTKTDTVKYDQTFGITAGVNDVEMHSGSTLVVLDPKRVKGVVYLPKNVPGWNNAVENSDKKNFPTGGVYKNGGVDEGPYAAISKLEKGKAAFIGDSSPVEDSSPAYVREDNGGKKTTFDGFKNEGQDAVFLVQTVEWLAMHEDYTTFENQGITLDSTTPLLGTLEDPATSAEIPGTEPWTTPAAGYKWYDPSTYKAGAYGSGESGPIITIPDLTTIASARTAADNTYVTVQGVITSEPGVFGGNGFYLQDGTAGIYVYPGKPTGYHVGDKIKITAQKTIYNSEVELTNDVQVAKLDDQANIPAPVAIVQDSVNDSNQGQLISLKNVTVRNYATVTGSLEFDLVNGSTTNHVRVDSRTGVNADILKQSFPEGTAVDITGISSIFKNAYQLKLLNPGDIRPAGSSPGSEADNTATLTGPASAVAGSSIDLSVGVSKLTYTFTAMDVTIQYDPSKMTFDTQTDQDGNLILAENAITSSREGLSLLATGIKPNDGQIRLLMASTGEAHVVKDSGELFKLHGKLKADASGTADLSVTSFTASSDGSSQEIGTGAASAHIQVTAVDRSALLAAIQNAQKLADQAVIGTDPGQYPAAAKSDLLAAIQAANAVYNNASATQEQLGTALAALTSAVNTFKNAVIPYPSEPADKTVLTSVIASAQSIYDRAAAGDKVGQYPAAAKTALQSAIQSAVTVKNNASATQSQVDTAVSALNSAVAVFQTKLITLVPGAGKVSVQDLSIMAKYFGIKSTDSNWSRVAQADIFNEGEISIRALAAVAQMIIGDWYTK